MTDHAAAPAADIDRDDRPAAEPRHPANDGAPAPKLVMFGAADAPNCDGDGCVVPFAAKMPETGNANREGNTE